MRNILFITLVLALLAGCGQEPAPPTARPAPQPTAVPAPTATSPPTPTALIIGTPVTAATPVPEVAAPTTVTLPAPLYFVDEGQIQRLETDGRTRTTITAERPPRATASAISEFDLAPNDGDLAYVIITAEGGTALVQSDARGGNRQLLFSRPEVDVSTPRWSPDGTTIAVRLTPREGATSDIVGGVYLLPARPNPVAPLPDQTPQAWLPWVQNPAAPPQMLHPDDVLNPDQYPPSRQYIPLAWARDGSALALDGLYFSNTTCSLSIKDLTSCELITPVSPIEDAVVACGEASWSQDSLTIYLLLQPLGLPVLGPAIWQAGPWRGDVIALTPKEENGQRLLASDLYQAPDGLLYFFLVRTDQEPNPTYSPPLRYTMHRLLPGDSTLTQLRDDAYALREAAWAPGTAGAAVVRFEGQTPLLTWLPADGTAPVDLGAEGFDLFNLRWGIP